jgi:hypothetical protein
MATASLWRLGLALLHKAGLCSTSQRLAVLVDGLRLAGISLALRQKGCLGSPSERLAVTTDRFPSTGGILGHRGAYREKRDRCCQRDAFHLLAPLCETPVRKEGMIKRDELELTIAMEP